MKVNECIETGKRAGFRLRGTWLIDKEGGEITGTELAIALAKTKPSRIKVRLTDKDGRQIEAYAEVAGLQPDTESSGEGLMDLALTGFVEDVIPRVPTPAPIMTKDDPRGPEYGFYQISFEKNGYSEVDIDVTHFEWADAPDTKDVEYNYSFRFIYCEDHGYGDFIKWASDNT